MIKFEFEFEFEFELGERWREVCDTCVWYFGWTISHGKIRREGRIWEKEKREMVFDGFVLLLVCVYVYAECWVSRYLLTYLLTWWVGIRLHSVYCMYCVCVYSHKLQKPLGWNGFCLVEMNGWVDGGMEGWRDGYACMHVCMYGMNTDCV